MYDPFFQHPRPYNKVLQKVLYSDEVVKNYGKLQMIAQQQNLEAQKALGYEMKLPPTSYEQYKKINQERNTTNQSGASSSQNLNKVGSRVIQSASNKEREKQITNPDQKTPQPLNRTQATSDQNSQTRALSGQAINQASNSAQPASKVQ